LTTRRRSAERIPDGLSGQWVSLEEITALDLFRSTKRPFKVKLNANFSPRAGSNEPGIKAAVRREYQRGDVICEAGTYGSTAFLLLEGTATAFVPERPTPAPVAGRSGRSLASLKRLFRRRTGAPQPTEPSDRDVGEVSAYATLCGARVPAPVTLRAGDLFGIDTCINFYPRATTVRAEERCVAIEMLRSVLDTLRDFGAASSEIASRYRATAIREELHASSLFHDLTPDELEDLSARADLIDPGSAAVHDGIIYREGDASDAIYLVRSGTIALVRQRAGGEDVLTYVGRGTAFGLEVVLPNVAPASTALRCVSHPDLPAATIDKPLTIGRGEGCEVGLPAENRAVGRRHCRIEERDGVLYVVDLQSANGTLLNGTRVEEAAIRPGDRISVVEYTFEVVRDAAAVGTAPPRVITARGLDDFELVVVPVAALRAIAERNAQVLGSARSIASSIGVAAREDGTGAASTVGDVVALNLYNSQNVLLIDLERCTRCDECVRACATAHDGVARFTRDGPRFGKYLVTMACRSCTDPKCMIGCPVGSIRRRDSLEIQIEDWCIGCQHCAEQCPFGNINMVELATKPALAPPISEDVKLRATVCDLCAGYDGPNCVYACPHDAAIRVNPVAFLSPADRR
jgi:Fe-S-cluster-containing hydrogenase component 2/CRP-like cAMP-binding protein